MLKFAAGLALIGSVACSGHVSEHPLLEQEETHVLGSASRSQMVQLHVWSHDAHLRELATEASGRIRRASGVVVAVAPEPVVSDAVEIRWTSEYAEHSAFVGRWTGAILLGINAAEEGLVGYLVHEMMHALGAEHIEEGEVGVLAPASGGEHPITSSDLVKFCSVAKCDWFHPEDQ